MRTFYAIQQIYNIVDVTKVTAEDEDDAYDMVDYNNGSTIILTAKEAIVVAKTINKLRRKNGSEE